MKNNESSSFRCKNLDSIRTIAFLSTFLAHAFYSTDPNVLNSKAFNSAIEFSKVFSFGVPIFFVLSGFLISYLMLKEQETNDKFNLGKFYMRRILRIWPVYYVVIIIGFVICNFIVHIIFDDILKIEDSVLLALLVKPICALVLSLILSYLSYHYFEMKFLNFKTKFQTL